MGQWVVPNWTAGSSEWGEEGGEKYEKEGRSEVPMVFAFFFPLLIVLTKYRNQADENWEEKGRVKGKDALKQMVVEIKHKFLF